MRNRKLRDVANLLMVLISVVVFVVRPVAADDPPVDQGTQEGGETKVQAETSEARRDAIPVFNDGVDAMEAEDLPTALACFSKASEIDPDFVEAWSATAAIAMELKEYKTAADAAEQILRLRPDNTKAVGTAYYAAVMSGDVDRLKPSAERLAEIDPDMVSGEMLQHASVLFDDEHPDCARALLEVILERKPELAPAYFQLGLTCNLLGDVECAKKALEKFLELAPDDADASAAQSLLDYLTSQS